METIGNTNPMHNLEYQMMLIDSPELKNELTTVSPSKFVVFEDPLNR